MDKMYNYGIKPLISKGQDKAIRPTLLSQEFVFYCHNLLVIVYIMIGNLCLF